MVGKHYMVVVGALLGVLINGGCDDTEQYDEVRARAATVNGFALNGFALNGFALNGFALNGFALNGTENAPEAIELRSMVLPGVFKSKEIWIDDGNLHARRKDDVRSGDELEGAMIHFDIEENGHKKKKRTLRLNSIELLAGSEIWTYDVEVRTEDSQWTPLCRDSEGEPTRALLIDGAWDRTSGERIASGLESATFACRDAALAKCVELGYRPSKELGGESLEDVHQACTRMIRADYCGDATSHTVNGTPIHVLDQLGVQLQDLVMDYSVEAEWGPDGATCLNLENTRIADIELDCAPPPCGESFASGGVLQSGSLQAP